MPSSTWMPPPFGQTGTNSLAGRRCAPQVHMALWAARQNREILPSRMAFTVTENLRMGIALPRRADAGRQPGTGCHFGKQAVSPRVGMSFHGAANVEYFAARDSRSAGSAVVRR